MVRRHGKPGFDAGRLVDAHKNHPLPHLRNPVPDGVQQRVGNVVALIGKALRNQLGHVGAAMVQDVRYVLHQ
ncbi:hypothetical protein D3C87_1469550 [compost metagenome]